MLSTLNESQATCKLDYFLELFKFREIDVEKIVARSSSLDVFCYIVQRPSLSAGRFSAQLFTAKDPNIF